MKSHAVSPVVSNRGKRFGAAQLDPVSDFVAVSKLERQILKLEYPDAKTAFADLKFSGGMGKPVKIERVEEDPKEAPGLAAAAGLALQTDHVQHHAQVTVRGVRR